MVSEKARNATGWALLGLVLGILIFSIFYVWSYRTGVAQRFVWSWVGIHIAVLVLPPILLGVYGATRRPTATQ